MATTSSSAVAPAMAGRRNAIMANAGTSDTAAICGETSSPVSPTSTTPLATACGHATGDHSDRSSLGGVANGIRIDIDDTVAYVRDFGSKIPNARPSMLLDHMAGRMSEIEAINGAIAPAAQAAGLSAPFNTVVSALVRAKERRMGVRP